MSLNIEIRKVYLSSMAGHIAVHLEGDEGAPVVFITLQAREIIWLQIVSQ